MENGLNEKLTRIEDTVSIMKTNLHLSESEVIEKVAEATNLHNLANIFIQEEEPEAKNGIWIQADKETYPYDTIRIDGDIIIPGAWRFDLETELIKDSLTCSCVYENMFYFVTGQGLYSFDLETKATKLLVSGYVTGSNATSKMIANSDYIFVIGNSYIYVYDTTGTFIHVGNMNNNNPSCLCISMVPSIVYLYSSTNRGVYEYNVITNTPTLLYTAPWRVGFSALQQVSETKILCLRNSVDNCYLLDLLSNTCEVITSLQQIVAQSQDHIVHVLGDSLYTCIPAEKAVFKINLIDYTCQNIGEQFFNETDANFTKFQKLIYYNGKYYGLDYNNTSTYIIPQDSEEVQYNESSIIIFQAPIYRSNKQTALWTYPCLKGRMLQSFFDVFYYNRDTGFDFTLPVYYGNGTEWIKFKN